MARNAFLSAGGKKDARISKMATREFAHLAILPSGRPKGATPEHEV